MQQSHILKTALAATFFSAAGAALAEPTQYQDQMMETTMYDISSELDGNVFSLTRASVDRAAGVYCEWEGTANIDAQTKVISNVDMTSHECEALAGVDISHLEGGEVRSVGEAYGGMRYSMNIDGPNEQITELALSGPNNIGVESEYKRVWDFANDQVCVSAREWQNGGEPYVDDDKGCYDIEGNPYAADLETFFQPL